MSMYEIILAKFALIMKKLAQVNASEQKVYNSGYEKGKAEGGYTEGYDAGKQAEYDAFWDAYQDNGAEKGYLGAFCGSSWKKETFRPKHSIGVDETQTYNGTYMFFHFNEGNAAIDLVEHCKELGITIDFSNFSYLTSAFSYSYISRLGIVDFKTITTAEGSYAWSSLFIGCPYLKTIDKLVFYETNPDFNGAMFQNCAKLENITVEGVIAKNGLNLQWSTNLSKESFVSTVNAFSATISGLSVTFSKTAKEAAFTDDEWAALIATKPNLTINLV